MSIENNSNIDGSALATSSNDNLEKRAMEDGSVIYKEDYELDDIKAMKKKLEYCDRDLGTFIDTEKGSGQDHRCVYLKADTGTYEFFKQCKTNP